jgi:hypothetical protein
MLVGLDTDAEMHVRAWMLGVAAGPDRADGFALAYDGVLRNARGADVRQRHGVAVCSRDRDRQPVVRHGANEFHRAPGRCADRLGRRGGDVDSAVLTGRVRIGVD